MRSSTRCAHVAWCWSLALCFFFTDTATPEIYTLSLHDALPISQHRPRQRLPRGAAAARGDRAPSGEGRGRQRDHGDHLGRRDRKSTRLNSSHSQNSYAVFCLKKKTTTNFVGVSASVHERVSRRR